MSQEKYIGMDVHQATISVAVMDAGGKLALLMRSAPCASAPSHPLHVVPPRNRQWAGSREVLSRSGRGGTFFLTSLFIEFSEPGAGRNGSFSMFP
jgi:hypothetical protein